MTAAGGSRIHRFIGRDPKRQTEHPPRLQQGKTTKKGKNVPFHGWLTTNSSLAAAAAAMLSLLFLLSTARIIQQPPKPSHYKHREIITFVFRPSVLALVNVFMVIQQVNVDEILLVTCCCWL